MTTTSTVLVRMFAFAWQQRRSNDALLRMLFAPPRRETHRRQTASTTSYGTFY